VGRAKSALLSQKLMLEGAVRFVEKAREKMNIVDVYVFGSRARGDYKDISDIDLVVVARGVDKLSVIERMEALCHIKEPNVEYIVVSEDEWNNPYVGVKQDKGGGKTLGGAGRQSKLIVTPTFGVAVDG